jgi:hypothetical protein
MSKSRTHIFLCGSLMLLASCANYRAASLSSLSSDQVIYASQTVPVSAAWKIFDKKDCKTFLGRDVIAAGYIPIQMMIQNHSKDSMYLAADHFNIPLTPPQQVAEKVHTSTATRVIAWGAGGILFPPLLIPAIYDGIQSSKANRSLDADYSFKSLSERTIQPQTAFNGIVFVTKDQINQPIEMFLLNQKTQEKITFQVKGDKNFPTHEELP